MNSISCHLCFKNVFITFWISQDAFPKRDSKQDLLPDDFEVSVCDKEEEKKRRRKLFCILLVAAITTGLLVLVATLPFLLGR